MFRFIGQSELSPFQCGISLEFSRFIQLQIPFGKSKTAADYLISHRRFCQIDDLSWLVLRNREKKFFLAQEIPFRCSQFFHKISSCLQNRSSFCQPGCICRNPHYLRICGIRVVFLIFSCHKITIFIVNSKNSTFKPGVAIRLFPLIPASL